MRESSATRAIRGSIMTPIESGSVRWIADGALVHRDDRIVYVGPARSLSKHHQGPVRDVRPWLIAPGFVDTHIHFPQTRIIGQATGPLLSWLRTSVFPEEARFRSRAYAQSVAREFTNRMIAAGTTCAAIFSSSDERATSVLFKHLADTGLRATVGLTLMNQRCPRSLAVGQQEALQASERLIASWHGYDGGRLHFAITPRFALSCSKGLLEGAGRLANETGVMVQTHIAETPKEAEETLLAHPYAKDYLDVYERAGLVGERTLFAHAIHLNRSQWRRVADRGARISHCPDSNFFLGSGRMDLSKADEYGVTVSLGTDVAAGRSFSIRHAMAHAYDNGHCLGRAPGLERLLRLATLDGAKALGCADVTGSLEAGKDADFILVDLKKRLTRKEDALAALLFDNDDLGVREVHVRGARLALATR